MTTTVSLDGRDPRAARMEMRSVLSAWRLTDSHWLAAAELVISELVTNAVRHGGGCLGVQVEANNRVVTVSVADNSSIIPHPRTDIAGESGRGMIIVEALTQRWGVEAHGGGKKVWALLLPCPPDAEYTT